MADVRRIGWREVVVVAVFAVAVVLAIEVVTTLVPGLREALDVTPVVAIGLIVVTAALLWRLATRPGLADADGGDGPPPSGGDPSPGDPSRADPSRGEPLG